MDEAIPLDAVLLEVLRNGLEAAAEEMGVVLKRTSFSPNIKERMDASCAIFDSRAALVAQAEHVPVHLGSMMRAVSSVLARCEPLEEGDVIIVNDPFVSGAHLPDITLIAPVHMEGRLLAYVACRAHHADVGGMEPGSMPGRSSEIFQEGLIIPPVKFVRGGVILTDILDLLLANVRTPEERRGDINAQLACLRVGERRLKEMAQRLGTSIVAAGMTEILAYSERWARNRISAMPDGVYLATDQLDDDGISGEPVIIKVRVEVEGDQLRLDFAGTSPQCRGNINAVAPMTYSSIFFAVKMLIDAGLPANAGVLRPIEVHIPEGCFLNARHPAAVCSGNSETTQRVADALLRAFAQIAPDRISAGCQGTQNCITLGGTNPETGRAYAYIEAICGGQGGRPMGPGMSAVQVNMSNTQNTPVESLEIAYPLLVERYELRDGSGGQGQHAGGDGVIRQLRVVGHDARLSLQTDRRRFAPYGLHGGADGQHGRNGLIDRDGAWQPLPGKGSLTLHDGESVVIETPGGGGWGASG